VLALRCYALSTRYTIITIQIIAPRAKTKKLIPSMSCPFRIGIIAACADSLNPHTQYAASLSLFSRPLFTFPTQRYPTVCTGLTPASVVCCQYFATLLSGLNEVLLSELIGAVEATYSPRPTVTALPWYCAELSKTYGAFRLLRGRVSPPSTHANGTLTHATSVPTLTH
jgi:hypothetical protein